MGANKKKSWISNIIFIGLIALVLFTPVGSKLKYWASKLMASFTPSVQKVEKRERLTDYHWQLIDNNGQSFNLSQAQGKVIFLNTWATWCPPCIAEMPQTPKLRWINLWWTKAMIYRHTTFSLPHPLNWLPTPFPSLF